MCVMDFVHVLVKKRSVQSSMYNVKYKIINERVEKEMKEMEGEGGRGGEERVREINANECERDHDEGLGEEHVSQHVV